MRMSIERCSPGLLPRLLLAAALSAGGCAQDQKSSGCYVCAAVGGDLVDGVQRTGCLGADACAPYLQAGYLCQDPLSGALPNGALPPGPSTKQLLGFHFDPTIVPEMPVTDQSALTVRARTPHGTNVTALVASFVLAGKRVTVNGVEQVSDVTANDFSRPVSYVVTATDGSTATYVVTVTSSAVAPPTPTGVQAVAGFAQANLSWTASEGAWSYTVYYSTDSAVSPTNHTGMVRTPPGSGITSGPVGPLEIGKKFYFVVTADDGTLSSAPSSPPVSATPTVSASTKQLLGFHFDPKIAPAMPVTDQSALTVTARTPHGTNVTALVASFVLAGKRVTVNGVEQVSDVTANDFSRPVSYVVTAIDGSSATYVVTVTSSAVAPPTPTGVQAVAGFAQANLRWTASKGAWSYTVYYSTSSAVSPTSYTGKVQTPPGSGITSGPVGPLEIGKRFYFVVTADDGTLSSAPSSPPVSATPTATGSWTWLSGYDPSNPGTGTYGTKGVASAGNMPPPRERTMTWASSNGSLFLFGGARRNASGTTRLNDLWRFDGQYWTWVSGANTPDQPTSPSGPGAREGAAAWSDASGNFYVFGGYGLDLGGKLGRLDDLWRFDVAAGTWSILLPGLPIADAKGVYGTLGTVAPNNVPGGRDGAVVWVTASGSSGTVWLFGGFGVDSAGSLGPLDDLWKLEGSGWTWVAGSNRIDQPASYGTLGQASAANVPGARSDGVGWVDGSGNLLLFGGHRDAGGTAAAFNDLWRFDRAASTWTWIGGASTANHVGIYGTKGAPGATVWPGARQGAVCWKDPSGTWLFGGLGYATGPSAAQLNDLWRFDGTAWTWVSGDDVTSQPGHYGTKGLPNLDNAPSARQYAAGWAGTDGKLFMFGGGQPDLSELWVYVP